MIQELLLALSGHSSPLLFDKHEKTAGSTTHDFLSPPEVALLRALSQDLGQKHKNIRAKANDVVANHTSIICRAVCSAILSRYLAQFQQKILDVERSILDGDSSIVGAYNIVPLSSIVGAFDGWERKLEWLWKLVSRIQNQEMRIDDKRDQRLRTGSDIISYLRDATHTGYPDIEEISLGLVQVAETAWLKQLTSWLLYGKLTTFGAADFFISETTQQSNSSEHGITYGIRPEMIPPFIETETANSILFIGRSLDYLRKRGTATGEGFRDLSDLQACHLSELSSLTFPISPSRFSAAIRSIRMSLSRNALQKLLPLAKVRETLRLLKDFFLLERGEFALALVTSADERLLEKQNSALDKYKLKGSDSLRNVMIKEGEVNSILPRVWTTLASYQDLDDEDGDEDLELARELIGLSLESKARNYTASTSGPGLTSLPDAFQDLLLPTTTVLTLQVRSPLDLFLSQVDTVIYSRIHAYLLAIRRAHLHLNKLMTLPALRRDPKAPLAGSASERSKAFVDTKNRTDERFKRLRPVWATVASSSFLLAELGAYFHGEVISSSWNDFREWLDPLETASSRSQSNGETRLNARYHAVDAEPSLHNSMVQAEEPLRDPERLMTAHQSFLQSLCRSLLLDKATFTTRLRALMTSVDHLCALMSRLNILQQSADVGSHDHTTQALNNSAAEEASLFNDLTSICQKIDSGVTALVKLLREIDAKRATTISPHQTNSLENRDEFFPRMSNRLDRLLLKLDYTSPRTRASYVEDADATGWSE